MDSGCKDANPCHDFNINDERNENLPSIRICILLLIMNVSFRDILQENVNHNIHMYDMYVKHLICN